MPEHGWLREGTSPLHCLNDWLAHRMEFFQITRGTVARLVGAQVSEVSHWTRYWPERQEPNKPVPDYAARRVAERYVRAELSLVERLCNLRRSARALGDAVRNLVRVEDGTSTDEIDLVDWLTAAAKDSAFLEAARLFHSYEYAIDRWSDYLDGAETACRMASVVRRKNDRWHFLSKHNVDAHCRADVKTFTRLFLMTKDANGKVPRLILTICEALWIDFAKSAKRLLSTELDDYLLSWSAIEVFYLANEKYKTDLREFESETVQKINRTTNCHKILKLGLEFSSRNLRDRGIIKVDADLMHKAHLKFDLYYYGDLSTQDLETPSLDNSHRPFARRAVPHMLLDMIKHGAESPHKRDLEYKALRVVVDRFGPSILTDCSERLFDIIERDAVNFTPDQRNWMRRNRSGP